MGGIAAARDRTGPERWFTVTTTTLCSGNAVLQYVVEFAALERKRCKSSDS
jgi:hypothetical protein